MKRTHQQRAVDRIVRDGRKRAFALERETMTDAQLEERIVDTIIKTMLARGYVLVADLVAVNIPIQRVDKARLMRCMDRAVSECPQIKRVGCMP